jgi:hypothetical protein
VIRPLAQFPRRNELLFDCLRESAPPRDHTGAPYHCKSGIHTVVGVRSADAHEIGHATEPTVSTDESSQPVTVHNLIAIEVSPVVPVSPISFAAQAHIQIVRNADEPKFQRIQVQLIRHDLSAKMHQGVFDL